MSRCTLILLGLILALAVGGYFFTQHVEQHPGVQTVYVPLGKKDWKSAQEIWIYQGQAKKGFKLVRAGERWLIKGAFDKPASQALVEDFLKDLAGLVGEQRACGQKFFPRFELLPEEALHIVLYKDQRVLGHLLVGKRGPRWQSTFVRLKGKDCIYLVPVNLLAKFDIWSADPAPPKDKELLDLVVFNEPLLKLKNLRFEAQNSSWVLRRTEKGFLLTKGKDKIRLSLSEAQKFWQHLFPLYAETVLAPEEFHVPKATLFFESRLGRQLKIILGPCKGPKEDRVCLVKKEGFVYQVKEDLLKPLWAPEKSL